MLGFFKRLFSAEEEIVEDPAVTAEDLGKLETELKQLSPGTADAARLFNRAGDLYLAQEDRESALKRYGQAVDAYLSAAEYDNAMAVCRKILRVRPNVVRARCTLAWLCLGKGFYEIAREHIQSYTVAAREAEQTNLAIQQLRLMAQYVDRGDFREFIAEQLELLDDTKAARDVREREADPAVRATGWGAVVFAALLAPEELRRAVEHGEQISVPTPESETEGLERFFFHPDS